MNRKVTQNNEPAVWNFETVIGTDEVRGRALPPALGVARIVERDAETALHRRDRDRGRPLDLGQLVVERQAATLRCAIVGTVAQTQRHQTRGQRGLLADRVVGMSVEQDHVGTHIVAPRDLVENLHHAVIGLERRLQRSPGGRVRGEAVTERGRSVSGRLAHGKH